MEQTANEIRSLKASIADLLSVQALPAIWSSGQPSQIVGILFDMLLEMLNLDFAYAQLNESIGGAPIEMVRLAQHRNLTAQPQEIGRMLNPWLGDTPHLSPVLVRNPIGDGDVSIVPLRLGSQGEMGVLIAGSVRADFPTQTERLLLNVAVNQVAIGLQEFRRLSEQRRVAQELDHQVTQRTRELVAANEMLSREIAERRRVEEAARAAKSQFEGILEIAQDAIISVNSNQRIILFNQGAEKVFGYTQAEVIGRPLDLLLPQRLEDVHRKHIEDFARSPDVARTMGQRREVSGRRKDGGEFPAEASISKLDLGRELVFTVIMRDITERKRAERLLAVENQLLEMIAKGNSLSSILDALCRVVEGTSAGSLCSILLLDSDGERLRHGAAPSLPASYTGAIDGSAIGPCAGSCGTAAYRREPVIVSDIATDPLWADYRVLASAYGLRACWSTPVLSSDASVLGTFAIYSREPRNPSSQQQSMIEQFSHLASIAIERTRAEEKLRQSERELRQLIEVAPQNILVLGPNMNPLYANRSLLEYHGISVADIQANDLCAGIYHPDDRERVLSEAQCATARGVEWETEVRLRRKDGRYRWFLLRANPLKDDHGQIVRWYSTGFDIEDRKQAEEIRTAQARQAGVRADVSAAFSKPGNLREMLRGCAEAIVRHLDAAFARIWTLNKNGNVLELQASAGMYTGLDGSYSRIPVGDLKVGWIAQEKKPHLTNDVLNDPRVSDKSWAQAGGFVSFAGYPLIVEERVVGVMALFARHPLSECTLDALASVADATAQGIERTRAEEKLRQEERELRRITDAIPQLIVVLGPDGKILYGNQLVLDYSGLNVEDVMAEDFRARLFHPGDLERVRDERQTALVRGVPFELELRARRKDGQYRWFLIRFNPFQDEEGRIVRWYATGTDIEERKRAEERVRKENLALREEIDHSLMFEEIVGSSDALRKVLAQVTKVASSDSTVLILGETGTGKELIARAIHKRSHRSSRAFIRVNCAVIPPSLIASELFGHERGAFTGAHQRHLGRFELADHGTIFLDEIGELPAETQIALLRVLQEREIERVGGGRPISVDVRVLAATNRDLTAAMVAGTFRQDLFYRLSVFPIEIPSLRDRMDDIPLLVEYLIERYAKKAGKKFRHIQKQTLELFQVYEWPGNIRELQNVIERAVVLCEGETFSVEETWLKGEQHRQSKPMAPRATLREREKEIIESALAESRGQVAGPSGAAAKLGVPRQTLDSKIKALGIDKHRFTSRST